jgi:hemolysin activation/secretion protein
MLLAVPFALAACLACPGAIAAAVSLPGAVEPGHDRPLPQPEATPNFDFSVEAPRRSPVPRAVDEIHFKLADIQISGATVLHADSFRPLYAPLIGKTVSLADIFDVADAIEKEYRAAGYLLVRAYVPPQHVKDGIFTIRIVEGFVDSTLVQGGSRDARSIVKGYLTPVLHERPLRLKVIEQALLLSNGIPGVVATGILRPSPSVPGASDLIVTLTEPPIAYTLSSTNRGSHYSGEWTLTGDVTYNDIFGADQLDTSATIATRSPKNQSAVLSHYRMALGDSGLIGTIFGSVTNGAPAGSLGIAEIRSDSWAFGPRLTYPLLRTRSDSLTLDGGLTVQDARVSILGSPLSHDKWRVVDLSLAYASSSFLYGTFSYAGDVAQGLPILGASPDRSPELSLAGRSVFTKTTGLLRYTNTLAAPFSFVITGSGQYSMQPLITGEQILFGGSQIGRSYDPGAITGDSGAGASLEARYDAHIGDWGINNIQPYVYFEGAKVWNRSRPASAGIPLDDYSIDSVGLGLRAWLVRGFYVDLEGGRMLRSVPGSDGGKAATKILTDLSVTF